MSARVCLVTTGQPACNPRLVKEADALAEAGFDVHVVAAYSADWATDADRDLVKSRRWSQTFVDWRFTSAPWMYWTSRIRHRAACLAAPWIQTTRAADAAVSRITPELRRAASRVDADLYIAHNLGALPAAWSAATRHGARLGFDAEDCHVGQLVQDDRMRGVVERVEQRYLPDCDYVTASSPQIADAYRDAYGIPTPRCVLNVFPKTQRPAAPRPRPQSLPLTLYWFSQTIGPGRGLEDVVRAMGRTQADGTVLHVRGFWAADYERQLRQVAAESGVTDERIVSHPVAAPDEMVRRCATYDIGLALEVGGTRNSDLALGNKLFTYLLGGQAILATRTTAQRWLLDHIGEAALGYDPGDVDTLAAHLRQWIERPDALAAARRASWACGDRRFNWEVERQVFLDVVRTALDAPAGRSHRDLEDAPRLQAVGTP
jgi:glycosyltransferase involved in cell wall biosynthesis